MRLSYGINLEQTQKLIMTPELRQAITVLQLSAVDLAQYVENAMLENPLLEVTEDADAEGVASSEKFKDDFTREWCEYLSECGQVDRSFDRAWAEEEGERYNFEHFVAQVPTLSEHLDLQLRLALSDPRDLKIGEFLIGNINDRGYLQISLEEVERTYGYPVRETERILKIIQSFDPPGVGARDLSECLLIQLEQRGWRTPALEKLVRQYLGDLANGNLLKIAAALDLPVQDVQHMADLIKTLDPIPGRNFSRPGENRYIAPDVVVEKFDDEYIILVNDISVPRLMINKTYQSLLNQQESCDPGTAQFIQNKLKSAIWLIRSIEQRRLTLYRVVSCIVEFQKEFLDKGVKYLKPLNLKQIADAAGLHESTVSRAIANKYIQTPQGLFELKFFFTSGVENVLAGKMVAAESIKQVLKELIAGEDPCRPYSDQQLCELLQAKGINIARRTVAKYRQEIGIPPVRQRKRYR
ncbi:MAG: polymerase sigma-54 factor [Clostridia bacterium]|uniref:RNA polymerase sigma-54 factor RpoN n=1 Tax=Thermacetogenium phaeum TaxID=85874 RepID=A0A101FGZ4_9THEO|nr:MAG: RNA polymerase sigma-54 factor RpoN [Thermacetogenium phaeum]MDK2881101.1 polymerase sigma-54 factor [Clostridia bacterium]